MKAKFVIICNFYNDKSRGILKVLDRKNLKSPFLQTYLYESQGDKYNARISGKTPYLYIKQNEISKNPIDDWQILLITDAIPAQEYANGSIFNSDTLVMYHNQPGDLVSVLDSQEIKHKRKGQHEPGEEKGYPLINYLVDAFDETTDGFEEKKYDLAKKKLIDWFDVDELLEAKLSLLNKVVNNKLPESLDAILTSYKPSFETFKTYNWEDQFSTNPKTVENYETAYKIFLEALEVD